LGCIFGVVVYRPEELLPNGTVNSREGIVEEEEGGGIVEGSSQREARLLTSRKVYSALAEEGRIFRG